LFKTGLLLMEKLFYFALFILVAQSCLVVGLRLLGMPFFLTVVSSALIGSIVTAGVRKLVSRWFTKKNH